MRTQQLACLAGVCAGFFAAFFANAASVADIKIEIPYQKFVLTNGLTVIVHEDRKAPIVAVKLWYHVGSKNEKPGKTGFAHLFEHLLFTGSEHLKSTGDQRAFFEAMERIGATDMNGTPIPTARIILKMCPSTPWMWLFGWSPTAWGISSVRSHLERRSPTRPGRAKFSTCRVGDRRSGGSARMSLA